MQEQGLTKGAQYSGSVISLLISSLRGWQITASLSVSVFFKWSCHCPLASGALPRWRRQPLGGTALISSAPAVSLENGQLSGWDLIASAAWTTPASLAVLGGCFSLTPWREENPTPLPSLGLLEQEWGPKPSRLFKITGNLFPGWRGE